MAGQRALKFFGIVADAKGGRESTRALRTHIQCDGVVDVIDDYVAMVVSWKTLLIIRHEFAHVVTTFFSPKTRSELGALFENARARNRFVESLAAESLGEYLACAMSFYLFPDLREDLRDVDPDLHQLIGGILGEAEEISEQISIVPTGAARV